MHVFPIWETSRNQTGTNEDVLSKAGKVKLLITGNSRKRHSVTVSARAPSCMALHLCAFSTLRLQVIVPPPIFQLISWRVKESFGPGEWDGGPQWWKHVADHSLLFWLKETELIVLIIVGFWFFDFDSWGTLVAFPPPEWWCFLSVCVSLVLQF